GKLAVSEAIADMDAVMPLAPVRVFDLRSIFESENRPVKEFLVSALGHLAFSPDGRLLMVGDKIEYRLWNTERWQTNYTIEKPSRADEGFSTFSTDGSVIAIVMDRDMAKLIETKSGRELATLRSINAREIANLTFSSDGSILAMACASGQIQLWDL